MKRNFKMAMGLALAIVMLLTAVLTGCSGGNKPAKENAAPKGKVVLKLGHVSAPSHPYHVAAEAVAKEVAEKTKGAVEIQIFPSNQLGQQREMNEGLQLGSIDIVLTSSAVLAQFAPKVQVIDLPYIFRDREHAYKVFDGPLAKEIFSGVNAVGTYVTTWENGVRHFMDNVRPIKSPADMKGLKIRVMENKVYIEMTKLLGASPTPMAYGELYTALQQKTVDGADAPIGNIYTERFYEVQKYLVLDEHSYSPSIVLVSNNLAKKVGDENAKIIIETFKKYTKYQRDLVVKEDLEKLELLKKAGMQVYTPTADEKQQFITAVKPVWGQFEKVVGKDLIDKIASTK
ncbi:MAG: DctP family TRAP transporter solute-binding subunit [Sporomusaceae bacterium]|nr:DctP family TRAP transporter solute-binding subunit [Sporomusaceae bacterium]